MQRCRGTGEDFQSRSASLCIQVRAFLCMPSGYTSLATRPPPVTRSYLGSCSSGNDELARPSQAADDAARSERVCRCSRRSRTFTLEQRGCQGCGCSCVAAVDVVRQLSAAVWQARLVWAPRHGGVAGPEQVRVYAASIGPLGSELASLKPMQRRRSGALAPRRTSTIRPKTRGRAAGRPSRSMAVPGRRGAEGGPQVF